MAVAPQQETRLIADSRLRPELARRGFVADASGLRPVRPAAIVRPASEADVRAAVALARQRGLKLAASGTRHAMGGQALQDGAVLVDMRGLDQMRYDARSGLLTVQAGATWAQVQQHLDPLGRSVAVMQSSNIFSVGGTLAANAHGRDVRFGPVGDTVASMRVMLPDGRVVTCSRNENAELFRRVLGGYGLFGIVLSAQIATVPNELYQRRTASIPLEQFHSWYEDNVTRNPRARLLQARLSIAPGTLMRELQIILFEQTERGALRQLPPLDHSEGLFERMLHKLPFVAAQHGGFGRALLWELQQHVEPLLGRGLVTRNQAMSPPVEFLHSSAQSHTQVLQEYFVPREQLVPFVDKLRLAAQMHDTELLNITVRDLPADRTSALPYARGDGFAVVLYIDQNDGERVQGDVDAFTRAATDAALQHGGTFYLPYRLAQTAEQLRSAYPDAARVLAGRRNVDPGGMFENSVSRAFGA